MDKIKTLQDVKNVPETEFIHMIVYGEGKCPFCGKKLRSEIVGFGRDKVEQFYSCDCVVARAAEAHNMRMKEIKNSEFLKRREAEEKKYKEAKAAKPVTLTAAEVLSVVSGLMYPGLWYKGTLEKVEEALYYRRQPIFTAKGAKRGLLSYAKEKGLYNSMIRASEIMSEYVSQMDVTWHTDISLKIKEVCAETGMPETIIL